VPFARKIQTLIVLLVLLCGLYACGGHRDIVGKWRTAGPNSIVWEFAPNGTALIGVDQARYTFGDQHRIKIQTRYATSVYQMESSGDKLTLRPVTGASLELTRIK
jgi:hypothetical protein